MTDDIPDALGERMKRNYEDAYRITVPLRIPIVIRVDGRAFHSFCQDMEKPFDEQFIKLMNAVAFQLCSEINGARFAFIQSDEISILVHNYVTLQTKPWLGGGLQKMASVAAGIASAAMTRHSEFLSSGLAVFDARVFVLPESEVNNYFLWRQNDWSRNSLSMLARKFYSAEELHGQSKSAVHDMLHAKGVNWNSLPVHLRRGRSLRRDPDLRLDSSPPRFNEDTWYIEQLLRTEEDK